jgi:hypothetical protein
VLLLRSKFRVAVSQISDAIAQRDTQVKEDLTVAKARFDWLLRRLRGS